MEKKQCKECKEVKLTSEFYGVQGECKECTKKRVRLREQKLRKNPEWVKKERKRHREKYHRLGYKDLHKPTPKQRKEETEKYRKKYPEKLKATIASQRLPRKKGNHLHHWSYNEEHWKDCIELSVKDHYKIHRFLKYNKKTFMYRDLNGNLLDTKLKHQDYIDKIIRFF